MGEATPERWAAIPGYEGCYIASNYGQIRSLPRPHRKEHPGKILKPTRNPRDGYLHVGLCRDGVQKTWKVHQLIALTFKGPRPKGEVTRHLDGNPANNHVDNLAYGTQAQNAEDMVRHGRSIAGTRHPFSKLSDQDVTDIRIAWQKGFAGKELAASYGISPAAVSRIVNGRGCRNNGGIRPRPRERCHYPGCDQFTEEGTNRMGKPKVFCPDPAHNKTTAAQVRERMKNKSQKEQNHPLLRCLYCEAPFRRCHSRHIYCSLDCKVTATKLANVQRNSERIANCERCGEPFQVTRSDKRFCTVRCQDVAAYGRRQDRERTALGFTYLIARN